MAVSRVSLSSIVQGFPKSRSFLDGNSAYIPSSFESIATVTAAGGETSLSFTSIPQNYKHLQIRGIARDTNTAAGSVDNLVVILNGDTGSTHTRHWLWGNGSAAQAAGQTNFQLYTSLSSVRSGGSTPANTFAVGVLDILDYTNTSKYKTLRSFGGGDGNTVSTAYLVGLSSNLWQNTAAISSIQIKAAVTSFAAGTTYALYGIKG